MSIIISGVIYIILLAKEKYYAWLFAMFDCAVLVYLWYSKGIIGQAALYAFYVLNSIYAFNKWRKKDKNNQYVTQITHFSLTKNFIHFIILSVISVMLILVVGYLRNHYGLVSNFTIMDISILVFSLYALILQDFKYMESWLYYMVIDFMVFILYLKVGYYLLALVKAYWVIMGIYGFCRWAYKYSLQQKNS
ncbi:nicotinamide riboside transporter PnuC [Rickettsiales bacterium LUAb2]